MGLKSSDPNNYYKTFYEKDQMKYWPISIYTGKYGIGPAGSFKYINFCEKVNIKLMYECHD